MEYLQNRIDSFSKPVRIQNASKTGPAKNIKWSHPKSFLAQPATLAEAGFYFDPSYDERDNVTCFVCGKELAGWEELDDPFEIHWTKCAKTCAWAVIRCGLREEMDASGRFTFTDKNRLPSSKAMEKARLQLYTIGDGWIHDQARNHGANSNRLAKAGFVLTPQDSEDDLATCLYCSLSLSAWDATDDPMEEHRKRSPQCPFFINTSLTASTATKKSRVSSTSGPKPSSRTSTAPTRGRSRSDMPDIFEDTIEPLAPPAKSGTTTGGRKASKSTRKTIAPVEENDEEEEEEPGKNKKSGLASRSLSRKASSRITKTAKYIQEDEEEEEEEVTLTSTTTKSTTSSKKKSSRSRKTNATSAEKETEAVVESVDAPAVALNKPIKSKKSRSKKSVALSPSADEYATAPEGGEEQEEKVKPPPRKSTKPPARAKKSKQKLAHIDDEEDSERQTLKKSNNLKKAPRSKKPAPPPVMEEDDTAGGDSPDTEAENNTKISVQSTKAKRATIPHDTEEDERDPEPPIFSSKSTAVGGGSKSKKDVSSATLTTETEEEAPLKKLRSKSSRKNQPVPTPSPAPSESQDKNADGDGDGDDDEQLPAPKKVKRGKMKMDSDIKVVARKDDGSEDDCDGKVVVDQGGGKGKRAIANVVEDAEMDIRGSRSLITQTNEELEELIVPKNTAIPNSGVKNARTSSQVVSQRSSVAAVESREDIPSTTILKPPANTRGKAKVFEATDVSEPPIRHSDVSKSQTNPVVYASESDSDVEMEDATIVRKMLNKKSTSMERLRLPSPPVLLPSHPEEELDNTASEAEVRANLEDVDLDADTSMEAPKAKLLENKRKSLPQETQEQQGTFRLLHHRQSAAEDDEDDPAISFAPRLVTKSAEEQRSRTPDLVPIRTSNAPIILGGSQGSPTRDESESMVSTEHLTTPPRKVIFETSIPPHPVTATATTMKSVNTANISNDSSDRPSRAPPEEKHGMEESVPQITPYLSKLPFVALHVLSEAELDMTVEEWIRYQIEVEYDKFKRDGERELARLRKRAEEVRKVIEGL